MVIQIEAWIEIKAAFDWYEEQKDGLGNDFLQELEICYKDLVKNPKQFPFINNLFRRVKTNRFPYILLYEIEDEQITIENWR